MNKVLWISPNLNHYKTKFLNRLCEVTSWDIEVIAGRQISSEGHVQDKGKRKFQQINLTANKKSFQYSVTLYITLVKLLALKRFHTVLMPMEKKHFLLIIFLFILKKMFCFELVSYNHPLTKNKVRDLNVEKKITKLFFLLYNKIIFYTEESCNWAIQNNLLNEQKAFWANNTLDTEAIWRQYAFKINTSSEKTIMFIGRLIPSKRLDMLFQYFKVLKKKIPNVKLIIIGDGPNADLVKKEAKNDQNIFWRGAIVDENRICQEMLNTHLVFLPGASGLSIVHSFCYGKPYITLKDCKSHGPEISYLEDGNNGLILDNDIIANTDRISSLLHDNKIYESMCHNAFNKARELSIDNWCFSIGNAVIDKK